MVSVPSKKKKRKQDLHAKNQKIFKNFLFINTEKHFGPLQPKNLKTEFFSKKEFNSLLNIHDPVTF